MRKYLLALFGLALLLSACRIESNIVLDINEDGSATIGVEIGFDQEMLDLATQGGADPSDILGELPDLGGDTVEPINRVDGDMTYFGVQTTVDDLSTYEFNEALGSNFSEFSFVIDNEVATLVATVDATGVDGFGDVELPIDPSQITGDLFSANVIIKMPGTVTKHNADEVRSDGSLVWKLPLTGTTEIVATSDFGTSTNTVILFIVGGLMIIGAVAAGAAIRASKRKSEEAAVTAAAANAAEQSVTDDAEQPATDDGTAETEAERTTVDTPKGETSDVEPTIESDVSEDTSDSSETDNS